MALGLQDKLLFLAGMMQQLTWAPASSQIVSDGTWTCEISEYPIVSQSSLHPCSSFTGECCQQDVTSVGMQYTSSTHTPEVTLELDFEVWPACGDGLILTVEVVHSNTTLPVLIRKFDSGFAKAHREYSSHKISLLPSSMVRLFVHPRDSHDCDAVQIHDLKVWRTNIFNTI